MTKKDFELIAATLRAYRPGVPSDGFIWAEEEFADTLAHRFADALKTTNKQFNRDKFLRACGCSI